jgi:hypothetical protein
MTETLCKLHCVEIQHIKPRHKSHWKQRLKFVMLKDKTLATMSTNEQILHYARIMGYQISTTFRRFGPCSICRTIQPSLYSVCITADNLKYP